MIVAALATEVARSDAPAKIAADVIGVTAEGEQCTAFSTCRNLGRAARPRLHGPSGEIDLLADGQSSDETYGVYEFGADDQLTKVSSESAEVPARPSCSNDPIRRPARGPTAPSRWR